MAQAAFTQVSREHGMPMDTRVRPRMAATAAACLVAEQHARADGV